MMNKVYFLLRSHRPGHEMYYCWGAGEAGAHWTFKIAEACWWPTDDRPKLIAANEDSHVRVVAITKTEYFKRILQGK